MAKRVLRWVVCAVGISCLFALPAMLMPVSWMASVHEWSGLGKFPDAPVAVYLARAVSGFYAMFGGLMLIAAADLRRYAAIVTYCAWMGVFFGAAMVGTMLGAGMPLAWGLGEALTGPPTGIVILLLQRKSSAAEQPVVEGKLA